MARNAVRTSMVLSFVAISACVVRFDERNSPIANGGVSGLNADCRNVEIPPLPTPGGAAETRFVGRYDLTNPNRPRFDWSGNSMSARFEGTEVTWGMVGGVVQVFTVVIDGKAEKVILDGNTFEQQENAVVARKTHTLAPGIHEITVTRTSEALFGPVALVPFTFPGGTQLPPLQYERRIEIIGDSITCGYGNEGQNATCPYSEEYQRAGGGAVVQVPLSQNIYLAYGSIAARRLGAEVTTICYSGKGVLRNYRETAAVGGATANAPVADPDGKTTVPDYYLRRLATEIPEKDRPEMLWDFATETEPQVVVINLGTNDFASDVDQNGDPDGLDVARFREKYSSFYRVVRSNRPAAKVFLTVSPMFTDRYPLENARQTMRNVLQGIVEQAASEGDSNVYWMEFVEMGTRYGLGCDYHPNLNVHRIMADQLVGAIASKTCWSTVRQ